MLHCTYLYFAACQTIQFSSRTHPRCFHKNKNHRNQQCFSSPTIFQADSVSNDCRFLFDFVGTAQWFEQPSEALLPLTASITAACCLITPISTDRGSQKHAPTRSLQRAHPTNSLDPFFASRERRKMWSYQLWPTRPGQLESREVVAKWVRFSNWAAVLSIMASFDFSATWLTPSRATAASSAQNEGEEFDDSSSVAFSFTLWILHLKSLPHHVIFFTSKGDVSEGKWVEKLRLLLKLRWTTLFSDDDDEN